MATDENSPQKLRHKVLQAKQYTAVPNWILDDLCRSAGRGAIPYEAFHLLLFLLRESSVGYVDHSDTVEMPLKEIVEMTGISHETVSKWAHAFSYVGFLQYLPAHNGARASRFVLFPYGLPNERQVLAAINGMYDAAKEPSRTVEQFGQQVRRHALRWAMQLAKTEDEKVEVNKRFHFEKKGLL